MMPSSTRVLLLGLSVAHRSFRPPCWPRALADRGRLDYAGLQHPGTDGREPEASSAAEPDRDVDPVRTIRGRTQAGGVAGEAQQRHGRKISCRIRPSASNSTSRTRRSRAPTPFVPRTATIRGISASRSACRGPITTTSTSRSFSRTNTRSPSCISTTTAGASSGRTAGELPKVVDGGVQIGNEIREQRFFGYSVGRWVDDYTFEAGPLERCRKTACGSTRPAGRSATRCV